MRGVLAVGRVMLCLLLLPLTAGAEPGRIIGRVVVGGTQKHPVVVFVWGV